MSVANGTFTRTNSFGNDVARVIPMFFIESVPDEVASATAGRPIFRDEERVEIIFPGNPHTRPVKIVTNEERMKWPEQYAKFKAGQEMALDGTPIEEWPRLKKSQVYELKALGFLTIESVAAMNDLAIQRIGMGGRELKALAAAFLDDAERNKLNEQQNAVINRQDAELAALKNQLAQLSAMLTPMHAELQALKNQPHPIASMIPGMNDPMELAKAGFVPPQGAPATSSLADLAPRKRPASAVSVASKKEGAAA